MAHVLARRLVLDVHDWRYIVTDLDGVERGELWQAGDRRFTRPLAGGAGAATFSAALQLDNPMVDEFLGTSAATRLARLVKVYRDGALMGVLDVLTGEETADASNETFPFSAAGPLITRLNARFLGRDNVGYQDGSAVAQKDLCELIRNIILEANGPEFVAMHSGIDIGSVGFSSLGYVEKLYFKKMGELMLELSQGLGGPDFQIDPVEPTTILPDTGFPYARIGLLRVEGQIGQVRPKAIFEYGTGRRNLRSYRRPIDATGMANDVRHLAPGFPDSVQAGVTPVVGWANEATRPTRLRQDVVQADLQPDVMRYKLVEEHARIRGYPRETILVTPVADADVSYGTHYVEGDYVEARAKVRGRVRFDALFRIYGVEFTVDALGSESIELALINEGTQTL